MQFMRYGMMPVMAAVPAGLQREWPPLRSGFAHGEGRRTYEWRLDVGAATDGTHALADGIALGFEADGIALGFDISLVDRDRDGSFSWMAWGEGTVKVRYPASRGDAMLAGGATGQLRGVLQLSDGHGLAYRPVALAGGVTVQAKSDRRGRFALALPVGRYVLHSSGDSLDFEIYAGETVEATLSVAPPQGRVTGPDLFAAGA